MAAQRLGRIMLVKGHIQRKQTWITNICSECCNVFAVKIVTGEEITSQCESCTQKLLAGAKEEVS